MKKKLALALAGVMTFGLIGCGGSGSAPAKTPAADTKTEEAAPAETSTAEASTEGAAEETAEATEETSEDGAATEVAGMDELIEAAKAEGELVVYGSCEEEYLAAACENFEKLYGIKVQYQRLSTGEVQSKIEEENGNPSSAVLQRSVRSSFWLHLLICSSQFRSMSSQRRDPTELPAHLHQS